MVGRNSAEYGTDGNGACNKLLAFLQSSLLAALWICSLLFSMSAGVVFGGDSFFVAERWSVSNFPFTNMSILYLTNTSCFLGSVLEAGANMVPSNRRNNFQKALEVVWCWGTSGVLASVWVHVEVRSVSMILYNMFCS